MRSKGLSGYLALAAACMVFLASMGVLTVRAVQTRGQSGLDVGEMAPLFKLNDGRGHVVESAGLRGKVVVLFFAGSKCPVSADYLGRVRQMASVHGPDGVQVIRVEVGETIAPAELSDEAGVPTFLDSDGNIAARFGVTMTPSFCVIDKGGHLRYSGSFDDNRNSGQVKQRYLEDAVRRVSRGSPVLISSTQAFGCAVKRPN